MTGLTPPEVATLAPPRQGLNCYLSYSNGPATKAFRCRVSRITQQVLSIGEEAQAKVRGTYYPHAVTTGPFSIEVMLRGHGIMRAGAPDVSERDLFNRYLAQYARYVLSDEAFVQFPSMGVSIPGRGILRSGVPVSGASFGAQVGERLWRQVVTFEAVGDPLETTQVAPASSVDPRGTQDGSNPARFFYPFGQQDAGYAGSSATDDIIYPPAGTEPVVVSGDTSPNPSSTDGG